MSDVYHRQKFKNYRLYVVLKVIAFGPTCARIADKVCIFNSIKLVLSYHDTLIISRYTSYSIYLDPF